MGLSSFLVRAPSRCGPFAVHRSSSVWDKLANGGWVSELYIDTPGFGTWMPSIPRC
jgi:hypothetical protein